MHKARIVTVSHWPCVTDFMVYYLNGLRQGRYGPMDCGTFISTHKISLQVSLMVNFLS